MFVYLLVSGCLGLTFALLARDRLRADGLFAMPSFGFVATFAGTMLVPCSLYLAWAHPDWSWMYLIETRSLSSALGPAWAVVQAGSLLGGWIIGGQLVRTGPPRRVAVAVAGGGATILAFVVLLSERLAAYGTYETFAHDVAIGLMEVKLGYVLVVAVLAMLAAATQVCLELARDSRRVRVR